MSVCFDLAVLHAAGRGSVTHLNASQALSLLLHAAPTSSVAEVIAAARLNLSCFQPTFLVELSKVLANPGNTQVARVAAGLQVKNSLTSKDPDVKTQHQQRWLAIDGSARREIKNYVSVSACVRALFVAWRMSGSSDR